VRRDWDVIIAGASFAGLAAALELARAGRVLLLDAEEIGDHQTSACATPVEVLRRLQLEETEEQRHEELIFHLPGGGVRHFRPRLPFATFDYRAFCRGLAARGDAEFLRTRVVGLEGDRVLTREGEFTAPVLIDASGTRASTSGSVTASPGTAISGTSRPATTAASASSATDPVVASSRAWSSSWSRRSGTCPCMAACSPRGTGSRSRGG
jgi:flavin-dependent dehydrogenase